MDQAVIDSRYVCLKLIDLLYQKGLVNEATYRNIQVTYPRSKAQYCFFVKDVMYSAVSLPARHFSSMLVP